MPLNISGSIVNAGIAKTLNYKSIVTRGLIMHLDASAPDSYPGSGTTWFDLTGNGNNATINTTYHVWTNSNYFDISTDGSSGQAMTLASFRSNLATAHTLECFIYPKNGQPSMLSGQCGGNDCWSYGESGYYFDRTGATTLQTGYGTNVWQQLVITFDGSTTAFSYKNGASYSYSTNFLMSGISQGTAYIASRIWSPTASQYNLGCMRFYNRALSAAEILQNYNTQKSRFGLN